MLSLPPPAAAATDARPVAHSVDCQSLSFFHELVSVARRPALRSLTSHPATQTAAFLSV